jgi:hypothetical protein
MDDKEYEILMGMATGKIPRNQAWLNQRAQIGAASEEAMRATRAAKEQPTLSHREMELAQREFDLKHFGKTAMEKYARSLEPEDKLLLPGELLQGHSARAEEKRPVPPPGLKLQFHGSEPGCFMWKV